MASVAPAPPATGSAAYGAKAPTDAASLLRFSPSGSVALWVAVQKGPVIASAHVSVKVSCGGSDAFARARVLGWRRVFPFAPYSLRAVIDKDGKVAKVLPRLTSLTDRGGEIDRHLYSLVVVFPRELFDITGSGAEFRVKLTIKHGGAKSVNVHAFRRLAPTVNFPQREAFVLTDSQVLRESLPAQDDAFESSANEVFDDLSRANCAASEKPNAAATPAAGATVDSDEMDEEDRALAPVPALVSEVFSFGFADVLEVPSDVATRVYTISDLHLSCCARGRIAEPAMYHAMWNVFKGVASDLRAGHRVHVILLGDVVEFWNANCTVTPLDVFGLPNAPDAEKKRQAFDATPAGEFKCWLSQLWVLPGADGLLEVRFVRGNHDDIVCNEWLVRAFFGERVVYSPSYVFFVDASQPKRYPNGRILAAYAHGHQFDYYNCDPLRVPSELHCLKPARDGTFPVPAFGLVRQSGYYISMMHETSRNPIRNALSQNIAIQKSAMSQSVAWFPFVLNPLKLVEVACTEEWPERSVSPQGEGKRAPARELVLSREIYDQMAGPMSCFMTYVSSTMRLHFLADILPGKPRVIVMGHTHEKSAPLNRRVRGRAFVPYVYHNTDMGGRVSVVAMGRPPGPNAEITVSHRLIEEGPSLLRRVRNAFSICRKRPAAES